MSGSSTYADWIAVDWGTSNLRAWAMRGSDAIAEATSDKGMGLLEKSEFESALITLIDPWLGTARTPVFACGMVGARQGWVEAPYTAVPSKPLANRFARPETTDSRIDVHVIPGLKQLENPDVMRGEETQIAGFLAANPNFDGVLCLPGTHTKWAHISAGEVISFRTFMTGELFGLIAKKSVLRHSIANGWNDAAFITAVTDTLSRPETMAAKLFAIRADQLLNATDVGAAKARLSGLLIGAELAGAKPYWLGQNIVLIGDANLSALYATALETQAALSQIADATQSTLAGLNAARILTKEPTS
ncbi:2-dehydro-3-deoxygalactonokinase [uncultured Boseongicola sp.]|jgi:2-dehydro-3-deoxygalactonokinase|uniref:2-dehydro-3-deoxygalactonokinase n=1 Tax=uncultured Boseongicola sp. TaxID=1648499 RepID=UPI002602A732|nr:2-dehydro-3-deoxygalactonokinase [uncultured Boseongicola sp.]